MNGTFDGEVVGSAIPWLVHFAAGEKGKREVVDGDNRTAEIKNRPIEMGKMHEVEFLYVENF